MNLNQKHSSVDKPNNYCISANFLQKCIESNEPIHPNPLKTLILGEAKEHLLLLSKEIESEKAINNSGLLKFKAKHGHSENFKDTKNAGLLHSIDKSQHIKVFSNKFVENLDHMVENLLFLLNEAPKEKNSQIERKTIKERKKSNLGFLKNTIDNTGFRFIKPEIYNKTIYHKPIDEEYKKIMKKKIYSNGLSEKKERIMVKNDANFKQEKPFE